MPRRKSSRRRVRRDRSPKSSIPERRGFRLVNKNESGDLIDDRVYSGNDPKKAAMKAWKNNKSLDILLIQSIDGSQEYSFFAQEWMKVVNGKRKFKQSMNTRRTRVEMHIPEKRLPTRPVSPRKSQKGRKRSRKKKN